MRHKFLTLVGVSATAFALTACGTGAPLPAGSAASALTQRAGRHAAGKAPTVLFNFNACCGALDGYFPQADLVRDSTGNLYGSASGGANAQGIVYKISGTNETVLHNFSLTDGEYPISALILDPAENMYGSAYSGGKPGYGVIFKMDKSGNETVLYSFRNAADGANPQGSLIRAADGTLYGATANGGKNNNDNGVFFKLAPSGKETVLHTFGKGTDGYHPIGRIVTDAAGNFYGVTTGPKGGTLYKVTPAGKETIVAAFAGSSEPDGPASGLLRDSAGNLYGTSYYGGVGFGLVYKVTPAGHVTTLHAFKSGSDGAYPVGDLTFDASKSNLIGTTGSGGQVGQDCSCGTIFEIDAAGKESVLFRFGNLTDGAYPQAGLLFNEGNKTFYGTGEEGGTYDGGTVFTFKQ